MSKEAFTVSVCPTCNSRRIKRIRGKWDGVYRGEPYEVGDLEYYSCPNCGEKVYSPEAMRRIQGASPAYSRRAASAQRPGRGVAIAR